MTSMNFIGLEIHKKTISYCVKDAAGAVLAEGTISSTWQSLNDWIRTLHQLWTVAMEATMFTRWIYDHLLPHAAAVKVAHPLLLRAIAASKKKPWLNQSLLLCVSHEASQRVDITCARSSSMEHAPRSCAVSESGFQRARG
jgi:hypothetical protein